MPVVSYMPYYPDPRVNRTVGGFRIWNWWQYREQVIDDPQVREYLDRYFGLFVRANGDREERIAIISQVGSPYIPESDQFTKNEIFRFVYAVMACHLFELPPGPNGGYGACSSDNFVAFYKEFDLTERPPLPSFDYGSYIRTRVTGSWDHLRFTTPQYMPTPGPCPCEEELVTHLAGLCAAENQEIERLFRSLEWINLAFANYEGFRYGARIVAAVTAFEILLDLPDEGKSRHLSERVKELLPPNSMPTTRRAWGRSRKQVRDNDVGWWCRNFYKLRSRIVHGETLQPQNFRHTSGVEHLRIALNLFEECIRGLLIRWGRMQEDDRRRKFWLRPTWREQLGLPNNVWYR